MRRTLSGLAAAVLLAGAPAAAHAAMEEARAALLAGLWAQAEAAALADGSPEALVLAARAANARAYLSARSRDPDLAGNALAHARAALALQPDSLQARIELAAALGLEARARSAESVFLKNLAGQSKEALYDVLRADPANGEARALYGAWHLEALRRGGDTARALYGADLAEGMTQFEAAMRLGADKMTGVEYAALLLSIDPDHVDEAAAALRWTIVQPARTAMDREAHRRAIALLTAIRAPEERSALLAAWLGA